MILLPFTLIAICCFIGSTSGKNDQKLLVILADGFRYDYMDKSPVGGGLRTMARKGVRAKYVQPVFPTKSYPNWYTIATGQYVESHGMVGNDFYDPDSKSYFLMAPNPSSQETRYWAGAEPIWVTAEKQGVRTAMFWWDGCQVGVQGVNGTYCAPYGPENQYWTWDPSTFESDYQNATRLIMSKFSSNEWQLAMVYFEAMDGAGHAFGTKSVQVKEALEKLDDIIVVALKEIDKHKMADKVNIIILSDHGMIDFGPSYGTKQIKVTDIIDRKDIMYVGGGGPYALIWPTAGRNVTEMYRKFKDSPKSKGMKVYLKQDIPRKYHFRDNSRIAPILLVAEPGHLIDGLTEYPLIDAGTHGYDPFVVKEMGAGYLAMGPSFRSNYTAPPFVQVDHYNIFCSVLDISAHVNNGSYVRVANLLTRPDMKYANKGNALSPPYLALIGATFFSLRSLGKHPKV